MTSRLLGSFFLVFCTSFLFFSFASAQELRSTNFRVLDPVQTPGAFSSSANFRLFGNISQISVGTSTATNFNVSGGFLYYPFASSPVVTATSGNGQVSLSWTASTGALGWVVSGYNVGQSTTAGGPYTYTSLGNVTSSTRTGLTNGTTYYFVIRAEDAFGNSVATSTEVSSAPSAPASSPAPASAPAPSGGGVGGGGGFGFSAPSISPTKVVLKGGAYPKSTVVILKDGVELIRLLVKESGDWEFSHEVSGGIYTFSVYAIDDEDLRSITSSFTQNIPQYSTITISGILVSPTISTDKSQVKQGNDIKFFGSSYPDSKINVIINSEKVIASSTQSDKLGTWLFVLNSSVLEKGDHTTKSQTVTSDKVASSFSQTLAFRVGDIDTAFERLIEIISPKKPVCNPRGDINNDGKINLVDFSIMLFFWSQRNPQNPCADVNQDGVVNLIDFSIILFWWTG